VVSTQSTTRYRNNFFFFFFFLENEYLLFIQQSIYNTLGSDKRCYISNAFLFSTTSKLIQHAYLDIRIPHIYTRLSAVLQFQKLLEEDYKIKIIEKTKTFCTSKRSDFLLQVRNQGSFYQKKLRPS
jgi:hypothetical protein